MKLFLTLALATTTALGQTSSTTPADTNPQDQQPFTLTANSTLVLVPALVKTKSGQLVYTLKASDFLLTDDGIPQPLHLDEDTGSQPLALVICVQTGGGGAQHLHDYEGLGPMLDNLLGGIQHKVAVVAFDSTPTLVHRFSANLDSIATTLGTQDPGDPQANILDAISFSVDLLRTQPTTYRRAILLISENRDSTSKTTLDQALRAISDTNTAIYTMGFSSTGTAIGQEAAKLDSDEPGPEHGCFSHDPKTDPGVKTDGTVAPAEESKATQYYDCFAELLPPLRLAKIAQIAARNALRRNVSESVAKLTGGEAFKFSNAKQLQRDLITLSNHVPNRYVLSFHPQNPHPGLHAISLTLKDYDHLTIEARSSYWVDDPTTPPTPPGPPAK
jgi:VWFA-related protein